MHFPIYMQETNELWVVHLYTFLLSLRKLELQIAIGNIGTVDYDKKDKIA